MRQTTLVMVEVMPMMRWAALEAFGHAARRTERRTRAAMGEILLVAMPLTKRSMTGTVGRQKDARSSSRVQPSGPGATARGRRAVAVRIWEPMIQVGCLAGRSKSSDWAGRSKRRRAVGAASWGLEAGAASMSLIAFAGA